MRNGTSFVPDGLSASLTQDYVPRRVLEEQNELVPERAPFVELLPDYPRKRLHTLRTGRPRFFESICIAVEADDGMSWSAEAVAQALAQEPEYPAPLRVAGDPQSGGVPAVAALTGERRLLEIAVQEHLIAPFFSLSARRTWIVLGMGVTATLALLAAVTLLTRETGEAAQAAVVPGGWGLMLSSAAALAAGVLTNWISGYTGNRSEAQARAGLARELAEAAPERAEAFVRAVAQELAGAPFPRAVVVDDYERLDPTSRAVLSAYFGEAYENRRGAELWVVFEGRDGLRLSRTPQYAAGSAGVVGARRVFQQQPLNDDERRALAERLGVPGQWHIRKVKQLSTDQGREHAVQALIQQYLDDRAPRALGREMEVLWLLSLTVGSKDLALSREFLTREAVSGGQRKEVLHAFLREEPSPRLVARALDRIEDGLSVSISVWEREQARQYQVDRTAAGVLARMAPSLGLPPASLGHLFWMLMRHDQYGNGPVQAFWIRQIAFHCLHAGTQGVGDAQARARLDERLFEVLLYTIRGSLQVCLFEATTALLQRALGLLSDSALGDNDRARGRLLRLAWEAYAVLGADAVLRVVLELGRMERDSASADPPPVDAAVALSMETVPDARVSREALRYALASAAAREGPEVHDNLLARAVWMALAMQDRLLNFPAHFGVLGLQKALLVERDLPRLYQRTRDRVFREIDTGTPAILDLATLSILVWCGMLRTTGAVLEFEDGAEVADSLGQGIVRPAAPLPGAAERRERLASLMEMAIDAMLVGTELVSRARKGMGSSFSGHEFVMHAFGQELCAVALASGVGSCRAARNETGMELGPTVFPSLRTLFVEAGQHFGFAPPTLAGEATLDSADVILRVEQALRFCSLVWHRFDLLSWGELLRIRTLQFSVMATRSDTGSMAEARVASEGLLGPLAKAGYAAVLGNLSVASALDGWGEVRAHYCCRAAQAALTARMGDALGSELTLVAVVQCHSYGTCPPGLLAVLVQPQAGGSPLAAFLSSIPERNLPQWFLYCLNLAGDAEPAVAEAIQAVLSATLKGVRDPRYHEDLLARLEVVELAGRLRRNEPLDVDELVARWSQRRESHLYARFLMLMLGSRHARPDLYLEAMALLDRNGTNDVSDNYLLLALALARQVDHGAGPPAETLDLSGIVPFMRGAVQAWSGRESVENNLLGYSFLEQHDPENREYHQAKLWDWRMVKLKRDHLEVFPALAARGEYFMLFQEYALEMARFGLPMEIDLRELYRQRNVDGTRKTALIAAWKEEGGAVPDPLARRGGVAVVSADFLRLGYYLFSSPLSADPTMDPRRAEFDTAARDALDELFRMIWGLQGVPEGIRTLVAAFQNRLTGHVELAVSTVA